MNFRLAAQFGHIDARERVSEYFVSVTGLRKFSFTHDQIKLFVPKIKVLDCGRNEKLRSRVLHRAITSDRMIAVGSNSHDAHPTPPVDCTCSESQYFKLDTFHPGYLHTQLAELIISAEETRMHQKYPSTVRTSVPTRTIYNASQHRKLTCFINRRISASAQSIRPAE